jgi:hypothetical protein
MYFKQDLKTSSFADEFIHPLYTARGRTAAPATFPQHLSDIAFHSFIGVCTDNKAPPRSISCYI